MQVPRDPTAINMVKAVQNDNLVVTTRGGVIENTHQVHAAVVDASGNLLFHVGNPSRVTLIRSAAKPAQALAVLETGAPDSFGFEDKDIALMCASHNAEERHIERARGMLKKIQCEEGDLRCGGHPSIIPSVTEQWQRNGVTPTRVYNNCSGKHAGMMAGAKAIDAPVLDYHLHDHPMQERVKRVVEEVAGLGEDEVKWGTDGCNMPAPAYPLRLLAKTYANFAHAADDVEKGNVGQRTRNMARVFTAMASYPEQVGGDARFCTVLMELFKGQLIGKLGADGCYGIGIRESEETRKLGAEGALGISVKIGDGDRTILYAAVSEILERLKIGGQDVRDGLMRFHRLELKNTMDVVTGEVAFPFEMHASKQDGKGKSPAQLPFWMLGME